MPNDDSIEIPVTLDITKVTGDVGSLLEGKRTLPIPQPKARPQSRAQSLKVPMPRGMTYTPSKLSPPGLYKYYASTHQDSVARGFRMLARQEQLLSHVNKRNWYIEFDDNFMKRYFPSMPDNLSRLTPPILRESKDVIEDNESLFSEVTQEPISNIEYVINQAKDLIDQRNSALEEIISVVEDIASNTAKFRGGFFDPVEYDEEFIRSLSGMSDPTRGHLQWLERHYKRREFLERDHQLKLERQSLRQSHISKFFKGLPIEELKEKWKEFRGKSTLSPKAMETVNSTLRSWGIGIALGASTFLIKKTFGTILKVSKGILATFTNAAKQAETFKNIMSLLMAPLVTMFTLMFVPLLVALVPLIKTMFNWVISNKDAIMAVGDKLGAVFNEDALRVVSTALDFVLMVIQGLSKAFTANASMIDTSSLDKFVSSTIIAITNMIQDILMGIVAFCYSPEGQAFVNSLSLAVGKVIGTLLTSVALLLPVLFQSIHHSVFGVIDGIFSTLIKAILNMFDVMDRMTGGAISGFVNMIIDMVNSAINALNSINIFGFSPFDIPNVGHISFGNAGSNVSNTFDQGVVNHFNINNMMNIPNSGVLKDVMSTGVY